MDEFTLTIKGFKSKAQVKAFADWYEGQSEQDITVWLECNEELGVEYMNTKGKDEWAGNNLTMTIEPS